MNIQRIYSGVTRLLRAPVRLVKAFFINPIEFFRILNTASAISQARQYSRAYSDSVKSEINEEASNSENPLWNYFQDHQEGRGIWKWEHYFEIYHRHLKKFIGEKVNLVEIGIYSGGSLEMWRNYLGEKSSIHGVDIEDATRAYENEYTKISIGDQEDRSFWKKFKNEIDGGVDILIDDGGHTPDQQLVTIEEMLSYLNPGGVFICEDVHGNFIDGNFNRFTGFATGLAHELNYTKKTSTSSDDEIELRVSRLQKSIHSVHFYPYVVVIEKRKTPLKRLISLRRGTEWQPFLKRDKV